MKMKITEIDLGDPNFLCAPWGDDIKAVYIQLIERTDCWELTMGTYPKGMLPIHVHERDGEFWWRVQPLKAEAANRLLAEVAPLLENYPYLDRDEQAEIDEEMEAAIESIDEYDVIDGADANEYLEYSEWLDAEGQSVDQNDEEAIQWTDETVGTITAETTDDELEVMAGKLVAYAAADGVYVHSAKEALIEIREQLQINRDERASGD